MKMKRTWFAGGVLFCVLLAACEQPPRVYERSLYVFGTLISVSAWTRDEAAFDRAVERLDRQFQRMHRDWHAWRGEGELVRLNRAFAAGERMQVSDFLLPLLIQGKTLYDASDGLFNPAIGRLIALWGFHDDEPPGGPPPDADAIARLVDAAPGMDDIHIDGRQVRAGNPRVALDLGAYAKGYALNVAIRMLHEGGIDNAIVNAGGDLCVSGRHGKRPWHIGVRHPQGGGVIASLDAYDGECVLTSGNYERYREYQGVRYAHIIDPRSGYPVAHIASATVIARDGALADAAATALSVAGVPLWRRIAKRMGVDEVMLVDGEGRVYLTPAMEQRIHLEASR